MKETTLNKKVTNIKVELEIEDLGVILTEHFKRLYNMTTSEITVDLNELQHLGALVYVDCTREEVY